MKHTTTWTKTLATLALTTALAFFAPTTGAQHPEGWIENGDDCSVMTPGDHAGFATWPTGEFLWYTNTDDAEREVWELYDTHFDAYGTFTYFGLTTRPGVGDVYDFRLDVGTVGNATECWA